MGTTLCAITNSRSFDFNDISAVAEPIVTALNQIPFTVSQSYDYRGPEQIEKGAWEYEVREENEPPLIEIDGTSVFYLSLYANITEISSIYRYHLIYRAKELDWWQKARKELYAIVKTVGGTEVIWLPDQSYDLLVPYMCDMVWEGASYADVKNQMLQDLGEPVKDYNRLSLDTINSEKPVRQWFLDDFADLKRAS